MNIKKSSIWMLSLVFGMSVVLYILDAPIQQIKTPSIVTSTPIPTMSATLSAPVPTVGANAKRNFTATAQYQVRRFDESITVGVTLENNIVTNLTIDHRPKTGESGYYHNAFDGEIRPLVIGKNIKDINVSTVAGASDTSYGFMQAIRNIQTKI